MNTINELNFLTLISGIKGSSFVSIEALTDVKARKPFIGLKKRSNLTGIINFIYKNSVNNQRLRENKIDDFEPMPRSWGVRLKYKNYIFPLVYYKGNFYLEIKVTKILNTQYELNGKVYTYEDIKEFIYKKKQSTNRQKLNNPVILRDYKISSIKKIKFNGNEYSLNKE